MTKGEAQGVMHKMSTAITERTLDDTLRELNALPKDAVSSADGSIVATIPLGYLVEPPVEIGGAMVQPNSRAPSREGIDRIKTHFKANGYLKEVAVMIGVLSVSESIIADFKNIAMPFCKRVPFVVGRIIIMSGLAVSFSITCPSIFRQ
jgi:hypothetical protein